MEKFASTLARITLILTPILLAALGWALIFHPELLFKMVCTGLGCILLLAAAAVCIGLVRALFLRFKQ